MTFPALALARAMKSASVLSGELFGTDHHDRILHDQRDGSKSGDRIEGELRIERWLVATVVAREEHGVAVRLGARDRLGREVAAGAPRLLSTMHLLAEDLASSCCATSRAMMSAPPPGAERNDDAHEAVGPRPAPSCAAAARWWARARRGGGQA